MQGRHDHGQRGWALLALFILLVASVVVDGGIEDDFIQQGAAIDADEDIPDVDWRHPCRQDQIEQRQGPVRRGRSSADVVNPINTRWKISCSPDERERFITTLPLVMRDAENDDPHARKRRPAQFEEPEPKGSEDGDSSGDGDNSEGGDGS